MRNKNDKMETKDVRKKRKKGRKRRLSCLCSVAILIASNGSDIQRSVTATIKIESERKGGRREGYFFFFWQRGDNEWENGEGERRRGRCMRYSRKVGEKKNKGKRAGDRGISVGTNRPILTIVSRNRRIAQQH